MSGLYSVIMSLKFSWNKLDRNTENKETSIKKHRETFGAHIHCDTTLLIRRDWQKVPGCLPFKVGP